MKLIAGPNTDSILSELLDRYSTILPDRSTGRYTDAFDTDRRPFVLLYFI